MSKADTPPDGYRACVGIVLFNDRGLVFAGRRIDVGFDAWQLPQGGIDAGETVHQAGMRELAEETGTGHARIVDEISDWLTYDFPVDLAKRIWGGRYRGQAQKWLLARFTGTESDFDLTAAGHAEFDAWRWIGLDEIAAQIVPFKREVYARLVKDFDSRIAGETR